jgi:hypothetical protein
MKKKINVVYNLAFNNTYFVDFDVKHTCKSIPNAQLEIENEEKK